MECLDLPALPDAIREAKIMRFDGFLHFDALRAVERLFCEA